MRVSSRAAAPADIRANEAVSDLRTPEGGYWDRVIEGWHCSLAQRLWRAHGDAVNIRLLRRWLADRCGGL
jgi:hypothetical protein